LHCVGEQVTKFNISVLMNAFRPPVARAYMANQTARKITQTNVENWLEVIPELMVVSTWLYGIPLSGTTMVSGLENQSKRP
jgi:hypothetical protein